MKRLFVLTVFILFVLNTGRANNTIHSKKDSSFSFPKIHFNFLKQRPRFVSLYLNYNFTNQSLRLGLSRESNWYLSGPVCKCKGCPCAHPKKKDQLIGYSLTAQYNFEQNIWSTAGRIWSNHFWLLGLTPTGAINLNKNKPLYTAGLGYKFKLKRKRKRFSAFSRYEKRKDTRFRSVIFFEHGFYNEQPFLVSLSLFFGNNSMRR